MYSWASSLFYGSDDPVMAEARKTGRSPTAIAIDKNRAAIAAQERRAEELTTKIERDRACAKQALAQKNKTRAMTYLKRVKMQQAQLSKIEGVIFNLEQHSTALESSDLNMMTVDSMKTAAATMKTLQADPEGISETMDDIAETFQDAAEISERLAESFGGVDLDDDDLEAELAQLGAEDDAELEALMANETSTRVQTRESEPAFPTVPDSTPRRPIAEPEEDPYADLISQLQQL